MSTGPGRWAYGTLAQTQSTENVEKPVKLCRIPFNYDVHLEAGAFSALLHYISSVG